MKTIRYILYISLGLLALGALVTLGMLPETGESLLILHFQPDTGIDLYGTRNDVIYAIVFGGLLVAINAVLIRVFSRRERVISLLLACTSLLVSLLILIAIFVIVANNKEPSALFII